MIRALVDFRIDDVEEKSLVELGIKVIKTRPCYDVYEAINGHPDILAYFMDEKQVILHKNTDKAFVESIGDEGLNIQFSQNPLKNKYPKDIILNAVNLGNLFIHNLSYSDKFLLASNKGKKLINVKQGYTKCSTAIVNNTAVITSDKSIAKALKNESIDVLLLPPGDILLPGLNYGFIGGTCGLIDKNHMAFYGNLNNYIFGNEVIDFLKKYDVKPVYLSDGKLVDRGSIFVF